MHFGFLVIPPVRQQQNMINTNPSYCAECNDVCFTYRDGSSKSRGVFSELERQWTQTKNATVITFILWNFDYYRLLTEA